MLVLAHQSIQMTLARRKRGQAYVKSENNCPVDYFSENSLVGSFTFTGLIKMVLIFIQSDSVVGLGSNYQRPTHGSLP